MARIPRKSDGRRIFTAEFKREHIGRVLRGEITLTELSEKLGIARSLLHRWKRLMPQAAPSARALASPSGELRSDQHIRQLQLLVGKQTLDLELCRLELNTLKRLRRSAGATR